MCERKSTKSLAFASSPASAAAALASATSFLASATSFRRGSRSALDDDPRSSATDCFPGLGFRRLRWDDGKLRPWHYLHVYSIKGRLIPRGTRQGGAVARAVADEPLQRLLGTMPKSIVGLLQATRQTSAIHHAPCPDIRVRMTPARPQPPTSLRLGFRMGCHSPKQGGS